MTGPITDGIQRSLSQVRETITRGKFLVESTIMYVLLLCFNIFDEQIDNMLILEESLLEYGCNVYPLPTVGHYMVTSQTIGGLIRLSNDHPQYKGLIIEAKRFIM